MKIPKLQSIKENLTFKDLIFSGAPTAGTYTGYLNGYLNDLLPGWLTDTPSLVLAVTMVIFVIILIILYSVNEESQRKSLAEVLATGYFLNFSGKLTSLLRQKGEIVFLRATGPFSVRPGNVKLNIVLPVSRSDMGKIAQEIDRDTEIAYIDRKPFEEPNWWLMIRADENSGAVNIMEFPRTLFALPNYLSSDYTEKKSKKLHRAFNDKFRQLVRDNPGSRPPDERFEIVVGAS